MSKDERPGIEPGRSLRPSFDEWAMGVAQAVSLRGDCTRRQVGAVILDVNHRIIGAGYNGGPVGGASCLKGECPRGRHYRKVEAVRQAHGGFELPCHYPGLPGHEGCRPPLCACGSVWPCPDAVEPGSSYDTGPGACVAVHAELNAVLDVSDRRRLEGATLYVTAEPCGGCRKIIGNTGIVRVVWPGGEYRQGAGLL